MSISRPIRDPRCALHGILVKDAVKVAPQGRDGIQYPNSSSAEFVILDYDFLRYYYQRCAMFALVLSPNKLARFSLYWWKVMLTTT